MDSWPAEHWLGLNWTLGRCTLQIEARHLWNLLEVKKFPDGGFCIYHKSSVSSGNRILLGVRVAQEAGLEVQSQQIRFLLKTLLLACLRLSSQMGTEERQLWFVTPPSNCRTLESGNYLIFFHCLRRERPLLWRLSFCHSGNHRLGLTGFFFLLFYFYFWLCWVFVSVWGLSPVAESRGHSPSRCTGLSPSWPLLLRSTGSRRAGSVIVAHGPSCSAARGILPDQGSNPCPLHWQADSQPLRHQGSPGWLALPFPWHTVCTAIWQLQLLLSEEKERPLSSYTSLEKLVAEAKCLTCAFLKRTSLPHTFGKYPESIMEWSILQSGHGQVEGARCPQTWTLILALFLIYYVS